MQHISRVLEKKYQSVWGDFFTSFSTGTINFWVATVIYFGRKTDTIVVNISMKTTYPGKHIRDAGGLGREIPFFWRWVRAIKKYNIYIATRVKPHVRHTHWEAWFIQNLKVQRLRLSQTKIHKSRICFGVSVPVHRSTSNEGSREIRYGIKREVFRW
jgi:hypothetical protein